MSRVHNFTISMLPLVRLFFGDSVSSKASPARRSQYMRPRAKSAQKSCPWKQNIACGKKA
jgi:hypothetical protein